MLLHFVVISVFDRDNHRAAKLGPKDPDIAHQEVAASLAMAGVNAGKPLDPMWYLMAGDRVVGYVKVFREERYARNWFRDLKERKASRNFWAFWRDGKPLIWTKGANAREANQFVNYQSLCRVRAFSAESAAANGWKNWISGNLTAIEVDLDETRDRATDGKVKTETSAAHQSRSDAARYDRKYLELTRTFVIVIISPGDDDRAYAVWLMNQDEKGEIDFDHEEFVLALTTTRDAALNYAMKLATLLKLRVLEIAKT